MTTLRYRSLHRYSMARALEALVDLARTDPDPPFTFGPLDLAAVERNGLLVSGEDLSMVQAALAAIPGLTEVPA